MDHYSARAFPSMNSSLEISIQDTSKTYRPGITAGDILKEIPRKDTSEIIAAQLNGKPIDLFAPITESGKLDFVSVHSAKGLEILRHSTSHVMAQAVKELFPDVKVTIGPAIEDGFYYDFDKEEPFAPEDLAKIESKMREIVKAGYKFEKKKLKKSEAIKLFEKKSRKI